MRYSRLLLVPCCCLFGDGDIDGDVWLMVVRCQVRERDWANIITAHEGDATAYTWLLKDAAIGEVSTAATL
jgi:hypothetical protein